MTTKTSSSEITAEIAQQAELIYALAHRIAKASEGEDVEEYIDQLESEILSCLTYGDNETLDAAIHRSLELQDGDAFGEISRSIEESASWAELPESTEDVPVYAHLFAIPLTMEMPVKGLDPLLTNKEAMTRLEDVLSRSGIADGCPEVKIANYLYTYDELMELSFSQVYKIAGVLHEHANDTSAGSKAAPLFRRYGGEPVVEYMTQSEAKGATRIDRNIVLRFLVGVYIDRTMTDPFETAYDADDYSPELDSFQRSLEQWQFDAADALRICLGPDFSEKSLAVGPVDTFFLARAIGVEQYKQNVMLIQLHEALANKGLKLEQTRAYIASYGVDSEALEIRVSMISVMTHQMVAGLVYEIGDGCEPDETMDHIAKILTVEGTFSIDTIKELQPLPDSPSAPVEQNFIVKERDTQAVFNTMYLSNSRVLH